VKIDSAEPIAQSMLHLTAADVLRRVLAGLQSADITALPVKGVVTAYELYEQPWERPISDIDLRVRREDVSRVLSVADKARWKVLVDAPAYSNVVIEVAGLMVDVEGTVGPPGLCALSVDQMLRRATPSPRGHLVPEIHDHALLLAVNAFKDKMVKAAPWAMEDLARIVRMPSFQDEELTTRARAAGVVGLTWFVADWLARERADARWRALRDHLGARPPRPLYQRALSAAIGRDPEGLPARVLARVAADDPRHAAAALLAAVRLKARAVLFGRHP
jgi:Uncharacterised nucleotidyltransferase